MEPDKPLSKKHGRGIYRRFFYYVPAFGEGAVNYSITRWTGVKGSNGVHQMAGGFSLGTVTIRGRSCHCPACYAGDGEHCLWFESMKQELIWEQPLDMEVEAAGRRPELRGDQEKKGHQTAMTAFACMKLNRVFRWQASQEKGFLKEKMEAAPFTPFRSQSTRSLMRTPE